MSRITPLEKLIVPLGGQEIELQEIDFETGGIPLLRIRIRENKRFTVFDIDPVTARAWAKHMLGWADRQPGDASRVC